MLSRYGFIGILAVIAVGFAMAGLAVAWLLGPKKLVPIKCLSEESAEVALSSRQSADKVLAPRVFRIGSKQCTYERGVRTCDDTWMRSTIWNDPRRHYGSGPLPKPE